MNTKHTPGPWHVGMKPGPIVYGSEGEQVASLVVPMLPEQENRANARLIAKAPELADALAWALEQLDDDLDPDHQQAFAHARAVLAQATGGAS